MMSTGTGMSVAMPTVQTETVGSGAVGAVGAVGPGVGGTRPHHDNQIRARRIAAYVLACWPFMLVDEGPSVMERGPASHLVVLRRSDTSDGRFVVVTIDDRSVRFLSSGERVVEDVVANFDDLLGRLDQAVRFLSEGVS